MKVRDLIAEIEQGKVEYGVGFLDWDVYTEQINEADKQSKRAAWNCLTDSEGWEYFECVGFWTKFPHEKAFTINVNY